jgi:hypothetical protein
MAALLCITVSLAAIECILLSGQSKKLYTPVSLAAVVVAALLLTSIAINSGWIAAASFTFTYLALAFGLLLFNASLYSLETLFIPVLGSLVLLGELLLLILPAQMMFSAF